MKTRTLLIIDILYLVAMTLISLFYVFANFDKSISGQLGLAQLLFSIVAIIMLICSKKGRLSSIIYILYSVAQCVAAFFWVIYFDATFHIFPNMIAINWIGLLIHLLLLTWGIGAVAIRKRYSTL